METLDSDSKINVLINLPGKDIISICQTSTKMSEVCSSNRYDRLWRQKISEEFQIDYQGDNAFKKYIELQNLYKKTFYVAHYLSSEWLGDSWVYIFDTKAKAIDFIADTILRYSNEFNYFKIRKLLEEGVILEIQSDIYEITEERLEGSQTMSKERKEYDLKWKKIREYFPDFSRAEEEELGRVILELYDSLEWYGGDEKPLYDDIGQEAEDILQNFCEDMDIEENCEDVKKFIYSIL